VLLPSREPLVGDTQRVVWETIAVVSIPAAITAGSLIWQQHRADKREAQRVDREARALEASREDAARIRAEEREVEEEGHRRELAASWRAERRDLHTRLLTLLDTGFELFSSPLLDCRLADNPNVVVKEVVGEMDEHLLPKDLRQGLEQTASSVELLASEAAAWVGAEAARLLLEMDTDFYLSSYTTVAEILECEEQYQTLRKDYQKAARRDLGTST
jgi:hypothetical protein